MTETSKNKKSPAWKRGYADSGRGVVVGDNPYDEYDPCHWKWMEGWAAAGMEIIRQKAGLDREKASDPRDDGDPTLHEAAKNLYGA